MKPQLPQNQDQSELFRSRLDHQINMIHELAQLSSTFMPSPSVPLRWLRPG